MLVAFGGLPGSGKTTLAKAVARQHAALYLRIDTIEQSIRSSDVLSGDMGPAGYVIAYALAEENLRLGRMVVADCVNPIEITRSAWVEVARKAGVSPIEVEVLCSDVEEHRRRIEARLPDGRWATTVTWEAVLDRVYEPWSSAKIVIDTAGKSIVAAQ